MGDEADASAALARSDRTEVDTAELDAPDGGVGQAAQQLGERRLARTGLADHRNVGAGGQLDVDAVQHAAAFAVRELDVRGAHRQRSRRQRRRRGRLHDVDGHVEHRDDLAPTGDRGLGLVEDLAQLRDRAEDQVREEQERDDLTDVEPEAPTVEGGDDGDRGDGDRPEDVAEREHDREIEPGAHVRLVQAADALTQPSAGTVLETVRAHDRRAAHNLRHLGEHVAGARAGKVVRPQLPPLQEAEQRQHRQVGNHHHERELPRVDEHHQQGADDERAVDDPRDRAPLREPRERLDVARDARHEDALLRLVVVGQAQSVDVLEHPDAQPVERVFGGVHEPDVGDPAQPERQRDHAGREGRGRVDVDRSEPVGVEDAALEHLLHEDRHGELADGGGDGEAEAHAYPAAQLRTDAETSADDRDRAEGRERRVVVEQPLQLGVRMRHDLVEDAGGRRIRERVERRTRERFGVAPLRRCHRNASCS